MHDVSAPITISTSRKFLCFISWHAWTYADREHRSCQHCGQAQYLDEDQDREFSPSLWIDVDPIRERRE